MAEKHDVKKDFRTSFGARVSYGEYFLGQNIYYDDDPAADYPHDADFRPDPLYSQWGLIPKSPLARGSFRAVKY
jgi:hypothetical protein